MRRVTDTVFDLNTALMAKLVKLEGAVDNLVSTSSKMEARVQSIANECVVHSLKNLY
jgi:hypothetical protein